MFLFLHYLKSWGREQWSRRFLFFFFQCWPKRPGLCEVRFYPHCISSSLAKVHPWLYSTFNHLPASPFHSQLHTDTASSSYASLVKYPCTVQPLIPTPYLFPYYWRIKLNLCWLSNPSLCLAVWCGPGLTPKCYKPIFYAYYKGQISTPEGDCRIKWNAKKWLAGCIQKVLRCNYLSSGQWWGFSKGVGLAQDLRTPQGKWEKGQEQDVESMARCSDRISFYISSRQWGPMDPFVLKK